MIPPKECGLVVRLPIQIPGLRMNSMMELIWVQPAQRLNVENIVSNYWCLRNTFVVE